GPRALVRSAPHASAALLVSTFVLLGLDGLGTIPKVHEDEAPIAAPGSAFVTSGVFGSELHRGLYGMEKHDYVRLPIPSILSGAAMRLFGAGLFAARLAPLALA